MKFSRNIPNPSFAEFVTLMALMGAMVALSTDAMLPALPQIGQDLGVVRENSIQLIVSFIFIGTAFGQIIYGPLSDSVGRKPVIYLGYVVFISGCIISIVARDFPTMLVGRLLQGAGIAGPRSVSLALIRDKYEGRNMARVTSFVMAVFILVPAIAPGFGQAILFVADWRAIFTAFLILALLTAIWFALRQPETLPVERQIPFSLSRIGHAISTVVRNRIALGYTLAAGLISGAFLGYLNSAQQILQGQYALGDRFPIYFGAISLAIGSASFLNARLVMRFGMRFLTQRSLQAIFILGIMMSVYSWLWAGNPPLALFMLYFMTSFFCIGILFGNLNAMAMEPLGQIAGVGAAVVGSLSSFISVPLGIWIGQSYNATVIPLVAGFAILSAASLIVMHWAEGGKTIAQRA
jgi:MFS transporter, DHA1 family, multidrug resistance protein